MKRWFVTGTDTGVGKTAVSVALLRAGVERGLRVVGLKPAESGCPRRAGGLAPEDALALMAAANIPLGDEVVCPFRFEAAVAPGVAAEREGADLDWRRIAQCLAEAEAHTPDLLLVEGAGGLLVPMGRRGLVADLIRWLELPVLVVARGGLGTINHTLLTVEVAQARGLRVGGVVLSEPSSAASAEFVRSNADEIARRCSVPVLGILGPGQDTSGLNLAALVGERST